MKKIIYYCALMFAVIATSCSNEKEPIVAEEDVTLTNTEVSAKGPEGYYSENCPPSSFVIVSYSGHRNVGLSVKTSFKNGVCFEKSPLSLVPSFEHGYCPVSSCRTFPSNPPYGVRPDAHPETLFQHYYGIHGGVLTLESRSGKEYKYYFNRTGSLVHVW